MLQGSDILTSRGSFVNCTLSFGPYVCPLLPGIYAMKLVRYKLFNNICAVDFAHIQALEQGILPYGCYIERLVLMIVLYKKHYEVFCTGI